MWLTSQRQVFSRDELLVVHLTDIVHRGLTLSNTVTTLRHLPSISGSLVLTGNSSVGEGICLVDFDSVNKYRLTLDWFILYRYLAGTWSCHPAGF